MNTKDVDKFEYLKFCLGHKGLEIHSQTKNLKEKSFAIIDKIKSFCYVFTEESELLKIIYFNPRAEVHRDLLTFVESLFKKEIKISEFCGNAENLLKLYMG